MMANLLCRIFGHWMFFDSSDVSGGSTCKRCGFHTTAIKWPHGLPYKEPWQPFPRLQGYSPNDHKEVVK